VQGLADRMFMIMLQDFMDPWTFNQKNVMKCCKAFLQPGDLQIPFCAYNCVGYREQARVQLAARERWVACIADARPVDEYVACLQRAGLAIDAVEPHDEALAAMVRDIRAKVLGAEVLVKLKTLDLPGVDFEAANVMVRSAADAVRVGTLGYALIVATKKGRMNISPRPRWRGCRPSPPGASY
jgi:hypothetical protein